MEIAVRFEFPISNNEAEYEALILGLNICHDAGAKILSAFSDSQLIIWKVYGEFRDEDESMKIYLQRVKGFFTKFDNLKLAHIPRFENAQVDSLARLTSSTEMSQTRNIIWEVLPNPSINLMVSIVDWSETWMEPYV